MSVTIVSALSKPTQATTTENSARNASTGDNSAVSSFSSLLRGQLAPAAPKAVAQTDSPAENSAPSDAAALLAALGLISGESGNNSDTAEVEDTSDPGISKDDKTDSDISYSAQNVLQTTAAIGQNLDETKAEGASRRGVEKIDVTTPESPQLPLEQSVFR